jgi:hypothetical protein
MKKKREKNMQPAKLNIFPLAKEKGSKLWKHACFMVSLQLIRATIILFSFPFFLLYTEA